jgi:CDP-glycerol glycerophosphotransferase
MTAWSKLFRREFLVALDRPFGPGIHEDIQVTCAGLFAGQLAALDQVCYAYRRARHGSFMSTPGTDHGSVFAAYEQVLADLDRLATAGDPVATTAVRSAVFERAIWHYAAVLQAGRSGVFPFGRAGLVPHGGRRDFFARMHADFARYAPPGYRPPPGTRGAKLRLIRRGAYRTYELLEPLNRLRVVMRGARD